MNKVRICHLADFHIGSINENNKLANIINENLINALFNIFKTAESSKVDLVLIAGDFLETSFNNYRLLKDIKDIFENFSGKVIISPGNHDYISLESFYLDKWPDNVYIFKNENINFFEFKELNTRVYGFAFNHSHIYERKLMNFPTLDSKFINIGLFHGQMDEQMNSYAPIYKEDVKNSKLDYIALGHIHKRSEVQKLDNTYFAYSGNPVGRGFDELGAKGILLGDIGKNFNNLHFYKVLENEFHKIDIYLDEFESQVKIAEDIRIELKNRFKDKYTKNYYQIYLSGFRNKYQNLNLTYIKEYLNEIKYLELYDNTRLKINLDELLLEKSLKGIFAKNVFNSKEDDETKNKILDIGLKAFGDLL